MEVLPGKILIVDDDADLHRTITNNLKNKGYFIIVTKDGAEAIRNAGLFKPDLILIDIIVVNKYQLKCISELCPKAIILLTGPEQEYNNIRVQGIDVAAYISKPVKPEVLAKKIETLLRPLSAMPVNAIEHEQKQIFGELEINITNFIVYYKDKKIALAKKEFELLSLLASKPGRVFMRNEILQRVWGVDVLISDRTIDVHIRKIRQKTGIDMIKTVKRVGYKFQM